MINNINEKNENKGIFFSEIIESSLYKWSGQSWKWNDFPEFGSIVLIENNNKKMYAIVHSIETGPIDANRVPFTYQKTEFELLRDQPQIFEFIKTSFSCTPISYFEKNRMFYRLPNCPPKIHSFISYAKTEDIQEIFKHHDYLHLIFTSTNISNVDELLLAFLTTQKNISLLSNEKLEKFIETYSLLINNDYKRLKLFLNRISMAIK